MWFLGLVIMLFFVLLAVSACLESRKPSEDDVAEAVTEVDSHLFEDKDACRDYCDYAEEDMSVRAELEADILAQIKSEEERGLNNV